MAVSFNCSGTLARLGDIISAVFCSFGGKYYSFQMFSFVFFIVCGTFQWVLLGSYAPQCFRLVVNDI